MNSADGCSRCGRFLTGPNFADLLDSDTDYPGLAALRRIELIRRSPGVHVTIIQKNW